MKNHMTMVVAIIIISFLSGLAGAWSYQFLFPRSIAADAITSVPLTEISSYTLLQRMNANDSSFVIVDTRDKDSYVLGHIKGAISMTPDQVSSRYKELPKNKDIIVYCWSSECMLGPGVSSTLVGLGVRKVKELRIGWCEWSERGYPIDGTRYILRSECLQPQRSTNNETVIAVDSASGQCTSNGNQTC
jgi:rhodanese-related sulfurtransferase